MGLCDWFRSLFKDKTIEDTRNSFDHSRFVATMNHVFSDSRFPSFGKYAMLIRGKFYEIVDGDTLPVRLKPVKSIFKDDLESAKVGVFKPKISRWERLSNGWYLFRISCDFNYFYGLSPYYRPSEEGPIFTTYWLCNDFQILIHPDLKHYYVTSNQEKVKSIDLSNPYFLNKNGFSSLLLDDYLIHRCAADPYVDLLLIAGLPEHLNKLVFKLRNGIMARNTKDASKIDLGTF